jgi:hypothetical protein
MAMLNNQRVYGIYGNIMGISIVFPIPNFIGEYQW